MWPFLRCYCDYYQFIDDFYLLDFVIKYILLCTIIYVVNIKSTFIVLCGGFWSSASPRLSNVFNKMKKKSMCFFHCHRWTLQSATSWTPTCQPSFLSNRQSTPLSMFSDSVNCNSHEVTSWTLSYFLNKTFCHFLTFQKQDVDKLTK